MREPEDLTKRLSDEDLSLRLKRDLDYNPLLKIAQELERRYEFTKDELGKVQKELNNKKKECEDLEKRLDKAQWSLSALRVDFSQDSW